MIHLNLDRGGTEGLQILCLGSHADDIEIGCGGTILRLAEQYPGCVFHWVVFSAIGVREAEARRAASLFVSAAALRGPLLKTFPDVALPAGHIFRIWMDFIGHPIAALLFALLLAFYTFGSEIGRAHV